jgi:co-chaperonin GroES (HSP10)
MAPGDRARPAQPGWDGHHPAGVLGRAPFPMEVKVGDRVLFGKYSGSEIKMDGEEHLIMREDDILGIIEK